MEQERPGNSIKRQRAALEVLVAAVQENDITLAEKMHLSTDAVICNQCQETGFHEFSRGGCRIRTYNSDARGVGRNRNEALMRAEGELVLFADEDIVYDDDYEDKIVRTFSAHPEADILMFNVSAVEERKTYENQRCRRVRWYNYGRYPTYSMCARLDSLRRANVWFSLLYGGGAPYSNGEDSLFLHDCLRKGLVMVSVPVSIGREQLREDGSSTWFTGYNEKFFYDRGVLYHDLYGHLQRPMALRFLLAHRKKLCKEYTVWEAYRLMVKGMHER